MKLRITYNFIYPSIRFVALVLMYNGSKSDVHVFVRNKIDYSIAGTGDIYPSGHPGEIVAAELYSTGRLIQ